MTKGVHKQYLMHFEINTTLEHNIIQLNTNDKNDKKAECTMENYVDYVALALRSEAV